MSDIPRVRSKKRLSDTSDASSSAGSSAGSSSGSTKKSSSSSKTKKSSSSSRPGGHQVERDGAALSHSATSDFSDSRSRSSRRSFSSSSSRPGGDHDERHGGLLDIPPPMYGPGSLHDRALSAPVPPPPSPYWYSNNSGVDGVMGASVPSRYSSSSSALLSVPPAPTFGSHVQVPPPSHRRYSTDPSGDWSPAGGVSLTRSISADGYLRPTARPAVGQYRPYYLEREEDDLEYEDFHQQQRRSHAVIPHHIPLPPLAPSPRATHPVLPFEDLSATLEPLAASLSDEVDESAVSMDLGGAPNLDAYDLALSFGYLPPFYPSIFTLDGEDCPVSHSSSASSSPSLTGSISSSWSWSWSSSSSGDHTGLRSPSPVSFNGGLSLFNAPSRNRVKPACLYNGEGVNTWSQDD